MVARTLNEDGKPLKADEEPLGLVANDNPWEALHKIRNGQPGERMPALRASRQIAGHPRLLQTLASIRRAEQIVIRGNESRGLRFRQGVCHACHGLARSATVGGIGVTPARSRGVLTLGVAGVLAGVAGVAGLEAVVESTSTTEFCLSCHEMRIMHEEFTKSIHFRNRSGVRLECGDCHVPRDGLRKYIAKLEALDDVYAHFIGTIDTPEKFEARREDMAYTVRAAMKDDHSQACRNCHAFNATEPCQQADRPKQAHRSHGYRAHLHLPATRVSRTRAGELRDRPWLAEREPGDQPATRRSPCDDLRRGRQAERPRIPKTRRTRQGDANRGAQSRT